VIAAGNESQNANNVVPAGLDRGIVVSAYDVSDGRDNGFGWFSNYGDVVDIAAPGVGILSTYPGGDYQALDGTSMAAPHVAGAAALYKELNPGASPQAVIDAIVATGENGYTGQGGDHPEPLLDIAALLDL
jgi:subtilisin family serine protease